MPRRHRHSPQAQIASDQLAAQLYLPDARNGFYQGTRFDWSGVVAGLQYRGHQYYGPWYTKCVPTVYDYVDDGTDIVAGRQSAITGPAEEFPQPQGFETAKAGETFVKLGVGVLRKAADAPYSCYESYEIVDPGTWSVRTTATSVEFTHQLTDAKTGFGYVYRKNRQRWYPAARTCVIDHSLQNTGRVAITTDQYNHNFLTLDSAPIGPDFLISAAISPSHAIGAGSEVGGSSRRMRSASSKHWRPGTWSAFQSWASAKTLATTIFALKIERRGQVCGSQAIGR